MGIMGKFKNLEGLRFGKISVGKIHWERDKRGNTLWNCKCDCGIERLIRATSLRTGATSSCGCQAYETNSIRETTHGASRGPNKHLYQIWQGIKNRCLNDKAFAFKDYGGRGIQICDRWKNSFENFYEDMIEGYIDGLTIERKEVNGNYEKSNCCWITLAEQANNRRTTIYIDCKPWGKITIKDAAKIVGIGWQAMYVRVKHWPEERWFEQARPWNAK